MYVEQGFGVPAMYMLVFRVFPHDTLLPMYVMLHVPSSAADARFGAHPLARSEHELHTTCPPLENNHGCEKGTKRLEGFTEGIGFLR